MISKVLTSMMDLKSREDYLNRDFHFRNMHIYVNPDFGDYKSQISAFENDEEIEKNEIKVNDHVHIYFWNVNVSEMNIFAMTKFIRMMNHYTKKPVYIHLPKEANRTKLYMDTAFNTYNKESAIKICYIFIIEKSSYISNYAYDWNLSVSIAIKYGTKYDFHLCIAWNKGEFAYPYYQRVSDGSIKKIIL